MKITRTAFAQSAPGCIEIGAGGRQIDGLSHDDGIITVTDEPCVEYCLGEGSGGLCTKKFRSDLVVDELVIPEIGSEILCGTAVFAMTSRQKHCHGGCRLDPADCRLNGRVLFLKVLRPGRICPGDIMSETEKNI